MKHSKPLTAESAVYGTREPGDENREARRSKDTRKVEIDAWTSCCCDDAPKDPYS